MKTQEQRKLDRDINLKSLNGADLDGDSLDSKKWRGCITSVANNCKTSTNDKNELKQSETLRRSCLIVDYVKAARENIIIADKQKSFYDELQSGKSVKLISNTKSLDAKKASSDALLELTSKDVQTASEKSVRTAKQEMEKCYKDEVIVNAKECEKFLSVNKNENEKQIAELGMRQIAQELELKSKLDESDSQVKDFLKKEGYDQTTIDTMTSNKEKIETTKEEIMLRFSNQKAAIVAEMAAKIEAKTSTRDGKIDPVNDKAKLSEMSKEFSSRPTDLANLMKFNNIVSSYLEISQEGIKENSRNTASLFGEVKTMDKEEAKAMNEKIQKAKLSESKGTDKASSVNLDVKTINDNFLNYSTQKKEK